MYEEFNQKLQELTLKIEQFEHNEKRLKELRERKNSLERQKRELEWKLEKYKGEMEQLNKSSLKSLLYKLRGQYNQVLEWKKHECLKIATEYDQIAYQLTTVKAELEQLNIKNQVLRGSKEAYKRLYRQKYEALLEPQSHYASEILQLESTIKSLEGVLQDTHRALEVGNQVLDATKDILSGLEDAKGWGIYDVIGGGTLSNIAKHSYLDQANEQAEELNHLIERFKTELVAIKLTTPLKMEIDSFTKFADFFLDGFWIDWAVQSKITEAISSMEQVRHQVKEISSQLQQIQIKIEGAYRQAQARLVQVITEAQ